MLYIYDIFEWNKNIIIIFYNNNNNNYDNFLLNFKKLKIIIKKTV